MPACEIVVRVENHRAKVELLTFAMIDTSATFPAACPSSIR